MGKKRKTQTTERVRRFDEKLVLNQWMLSLFEVDKFDKLAEHLKPLELEGLDENNVHKYLHQLKLLWQYEEFPGDTLLGYDQNIVRHTLRLNEGRSAPIRWKYFQWLSLLFTEVYLDRFFRDPDKLRNDLNAFLAAFNAELSEKERLPPFEADDLRKLAFWNATGSGKTLLMHVNILQYQHYLRLHGRERELNRIILLTPNEGLSAQHLQEFHAAGMAAEIFSKESRSLFAGRTIEIIEVTKLKEEMGQKAVAIDAFEGNNLVLVDEGHRGASSSAEGAWMSARNRLCENGFSFEYSATFGQAMKGKKDLEPIYAKNILFDYSYKYFYRDGFGKDYRILNLADDTDEERRRLYLTACLLSFYQQQKLFAESPAAFRPFLLEKPLWIFVGDSVNAVRTQNKRQVSDVVDILLTLAEFVKQKRNSVKLLERLLGDHPGLLDQRGNEIFAQTFVYLRASKATPASIFDDILRLLFNASAQSALHVDHLKGTEGEIALRFGENAAFGLINVGDASNLCKLCEQHPELLVVSEKEFAGSLFREINDPRSTVNVLIGSKKFTEGWNSWRVSTMGLMNVGKSEGSGIIQLFGRGVRLKGHSMTLKRSSRLDGIDRPKQIGLLETLNIFGIRADYMRQFKEYLDDERVPTNENRIEFVLPVVRGLNGKRLKIVRVPENLNFKADGDKPTLSAPPEKLTKFPLAVNWYPKLQSRQSRDAVRAEEVVELHEGKLEERHLAFMDFDAIWFELQRFKHERSWHNLSIPRGCIRDLLLNPAWYRLWIPPEMLEFKRFDRVRHWEEIAVALLKKYIDRYYNHERQRWESGNSQYFELDEHDPSFVAEYRVLIDESAENIAQALLELKAEIGKQRIRERFSIGPLSAYWFGNHLYQPLLHLPKSGSNLIEVSPVVLNDGERNFVLDLKTYHDATPEFFENRELVLLRNVSKRGIGFFEAGNFYPDFILWLLAGERQFVTFVDPKGLRMLDDGLSNPKIQFYRTIKEIETRIGDPTVILNSFVVSDTPFQQVRWWTEDLSKAEFTKAHVLFQPDDRETYIERLLTMVISDEQVAVEA